MTAWTLATQARLGRPSQARAALAALDDERASSGEIANAAAAIALAEGDPTAALRALQDVLDGRAPVFSYLTVLETQLLAGLAHRELGDQRAAHQAAERALALAEPDRPVLAFLMTGCRELLETLPPHQTTHAALLTDILDVMRAASPVAWPPPAPTSSARANCGCCSISRRTCPGQRSRANCLSRSTPSIRKSAASTPSSRPVAAPQLCSARGNCGCWPAGAVARHAGPDRQPARRSEAGLRTVPWSV